MTAAIKSLFSSKSDAQKVLQKFKPSGFSSTGLNGAFDPASNSFKISRTPAMESALSGLTKGFSDQAAAFRSLRPMVAPGFGKLTEARVAGITNARNRAVGNLREELSRRRVLGSDFASNTIAGVEADFGQQESMARAESFLGELGATTDLIAKEFDSSIQGLQTELNQLNIEGGMGAELGGLASQLLEHNLTAQAQANAAHVAGQMELIGTLVGAFAPTGGP